MSETRVIVYADKTVLKITGMQVRGLKTGDLEARISEKLGSPVRLIGVTGESLSLDVYGMPPEQILQNEEGIVQAVSASEGITPADLIRIVSAKRAVPVDINRIPPFREGCRGERWRETHED